MKYSDINIRARQLLRDTNRTIFQEAEIQNGINEGIDRVRSIKELNGMKHLTDANEEPILLPNQYHSLLALFSASRCFFQDEQMQQATMLMNEFESKLFELKTDIENGDTIITDQEGNVVGDGTGSIDYIVDEYFNVSKEEIEWEV